MALSALCIIPPSHPAPPAPFFSSLVPLLSLAVCSLGTEGEQQLLNRAAAQRGFELSPVVPPAAAKHSPVQSAAGHLGYCRFQQKMMVKAKAGRVEVGILEQGGPSLAVSLSLSHSTAFFRYLSLYFFSF